MRTDFQICYQMRIVERDYVTMLELVLRWTAIWELVFGKGGEDTHDLCYEIDLYACSMWWCVTWWTIDVCNVLILGCSTDDWAFMRYQVRLDFWCLIFHDCIKSLFDDAIFMLWSMLDEWNELRDLMLEQSDMTNSWGWFMKWFEGFQKFPCGG